MPLSPLCTLAWKYAPANLGKGHTSTLAGRVRVGGSWSKVLPFTGPRSAHICSSVSVWEGEGHTVEWDVGGEGHTVE